jgi:hypothetical protein
VESADVKANGPRFFCVAAIGDRDVPIRRHTAIFMWALEVIMEKRKDQPRQQGEERSSPEQTGYSPEDWELQQQEQGGMENEKDLSENDELDRKGDIAEDEVENRRRAKK